MIRVLIDRNIEGKSLLLWGTLAAQGWLDKVSLKFVTFSDLNLPFDSNDRTVWRFAQKHGLVLFTDNRNMKGQDSLEQTIREENTETSLPVITIGSVRRLDEKAYREHCAERLIEIAIYLEDYIGTGRVFIP